MTKNRKVLIIIIIILLSISLFQLVVINKYTSLSKPKAKTSKYTPYTHKKSEVSIDNMDDIANSNGIIILEYTIEENILNVSYLFEGDYNTLSKVISNIKDKGYNVKLYNINGNNRECSATLMVYSKINW